MSEAYNLLSRSGASQYFCIFKSLISPFITKPYEMGNNWLPVFLLFIFVFFGTGESMGQILNPDRENSYNKVFVNTDNFGPSYLQTLEDALPGMQPDSLKFSLWNDLAYYWHTRNLIKALEITREGLDSVRIKKEGSGREDSRLPWAPFCFVWNNSIVHVRYWKMPKVKYLMRTFPSLTLSWDMFLKGRGNWTERRIMR